jgi:hypothetical protein
LNRKIVRIEENTTGLEPTCGVGEGGAASTGDRAEALLANLHKAAAPSSCCLELDELRRLISNSRPTWTDA